MQHPFLENRKHLYLYLLAWATLIVVQAAILFIYYDIPYKYAVADGIVFNAIYSVLGFGLWYTISYIASEKHLLVLHLNIWSKNRCEIGNFLSP